MKRWIRLSLLPAVVAIAATMGTAPADPAVCQDDDEETTDCRPAPQKWACMSVLGSCNLAYPPCYWLPFPLPESAPGPQ